MRVTPIKTKQGFTQRQKLSVLINTFNHERFIREAVDSVIGQQGIARDDVDVIVIDDGSTDGTRRILERYGDAIRYIRKDNGGQASAFNMGIPLCRGELVCMLDGDDWWEPDKLQRITAMFEADPSLVAIGNGLIIEDEVADIRERQTSGDVIILKHETPTDVLKFRKYMSFLGTSRLSMRREIAEALLPVPEPLVFEADEHFFTLLPAVGRVAILPDCLTHYRIHGRNLFHGSKTEESRLHHDRRRLRARAAVFACLSETLGPALARYGCAPALIPQLVTPVALEASRLNLMLGHGSRLQAIKVEWAEHQSRKAQSNNGLLIFALCRVALASVLAPATYYRIRTRYSSSFARTSFAAVTRAVRRCQQLMKRRSQKSK